ncbi:MAG TPA: ATP-binding cassette domain-containing protein, partial [Deltaproteobacteria bacterium]|nr:ATP-binding cassette domain-containing protein [Deltaproteobacteria bacterium]
MRAYRGQPRIFTAAHMAGRKAELEVQGLCLEFGGIHALKSVDLSVHTGELVAVIGPNGAGKTSLLNCITGFYKATSGDIVFNSESILRKHTHELTRLGIGRTFQNIELFPGMTVLQNMLLA